MNNFVRRVANFLKNTTQNKLFNKKVNSKKVYLFLVFALFVFILTSHNVYAETDIINGVMQGGMKAMSWLFLSLAQL
jgi:hypothetical protein